MVSLRNFWNTKIGKAIWNIYRMLFNDDTGVSMRKVLALNFAIMMDIIIMKYTDRDNLHESLWALGGMVGGLLGIVTWANLKKDENTNTDNAGSGSPQ